MHFAYSVLAGGNVLSGKRIKRNRINQISLTFVGLYKMDISACALYSLATRRAVAVGSKAEATGGSCLEAHACVQERSCVHAMHCRSFSERSSLLSVNRACRRAFPPCRFPLGTPRCGHSSEERRAKMSCCALVVRAWFVCCISLFVYFQS